MRRLGLGTGEEGFEGAAEQGVDVALDVVGGGDPTGACEVFVFFGEDFGEDGSGVGPFVTELIHDATVAVLGGDVEAEEFDSHPGDFLDEGGVIEEPPAAEDVEVCELSCCDAERVLVFAGEHRADEAVFGEGVADIFDGDDVGDVEAVACHFEGWVHVASDANHHGEGLAIVGAVGEDGFGEDAVGGGVGWESPIGGEGDHGVSGVDALCPVGEEAFDFVEGFTGEIGGDVVTPGCEFGRGVFPIEQERVDAECGGEGGVDGGVFVPVRAFGVIEGQIGHADAADFGLFENHVGKGVGGPLVEPFADSVEVAFCGVDSCDLEGGDDASAGFGDGRAVEEKFLPDEVSLFGAGGVPEASGVDIAAAEHFGDEVVVGEEFVDSPGDEVVEGGREEVGMDVEHGGVFDDLVNGLGESGHGRKEVRRF
ncbi:MAG: hypothetical protein RIS92_1371 [Verrucomicrobiota bacterium]